MEDRRAFLLSGCMVLFGPPPQQKSNNTRSVSEEHIAWVVKVLTRMQTIKPGMTRKALLSVFTTEGGISTALQRTYVSRDCLYFKVNVQFAAVGRPERDSDGRGTSIEDARDLIVSISEPYLQFGIQD